MASLHVELREHREHQGLTLEAIQAATRINPDFLKAMEQGDFGFLPRPYVRLFLRTYATQVGMDPQDVLDRYEEMSRPAQQAGVSLWSEKHTPRSFWALIQSSRRSPANATHKCEGLSDRQRQDRLLDPRSRGPDAAPGGTR